MADLTFSTTLLGQFLEDMEAYAEVKLVLQHATLNYCCALMPFRLLNITEQLLQVYYKYYFIVDKCFFFLSK